MERNKQEDPATISVIYERIQPMYDLAERRYNAAQARIQQLVALSIALMFGATGFLAAIDAKLTVTLPVVVAFVSLGLLIIGGLVAMAYGHLHMFGLDHAVKSALGESEAEYKRSALDWAVLDITQNVRLIDRKWWMVRGMILCLFVESIALVWWVFSTI